MGIVFKQDSQCTYKRKNWDAFVQTADAVEKQ